MIHIWILGFVALLGLLLGLAGMSVVYHLYRVNQRLQDDMTFSRRRIEQLENDLGALCTAAAGEGQHVLRLEQQMRGLSERQDALELRTGTEQPYARASQLAQDGASVDELVSSCGLTRAEAELVIMLHGACGRG